MATLDILSGKGAGTTIDLDQFTGKDRIVLGNRRTAAVPVRDPWVNFVHAEIHREGDSFRLADKRSKAGTFVNGEPVGTVGRVLSNGDTISLGKTDLRFTDANSGAPKAAGAAPAAAAAAPAAPAAPAGIGGMEPHAGGPFTPAAPLTGDARLTAELQRAKNEASSLRQAIVARERELAEVRNKLRALEGADPEALKAAREEAAHAQNGLGMALQQVQSAHAMVEETKQTARIKIEELTRLNQTLEMRLAQGGAADTVALDREVARLREEGRKVQDQGRRRIDQLTLEKAALEAQLAEAQAGGGPDPEAEAKLAEAVARAEAAEAKQDELEDRMGGIQSASRELELEVEDLRTQLETATANASGGDETKALEAAIAELNEDLAAAKDARREALQALQQKDEEVAALRGASGGGSGVDPAQLIALRNSLAKLEEQNAALEKQNTSLQDKLAVAEAQSEERGAVPAAAPEQSAELAAAQAALASAQAELEAARAAAPAPAAGGGDASALAELQARIATLEEDNASLLRDLEEINEDMLAQEEEYQTRITELEAQLGS
jgi:chromosome segregation ATPase